MMKATFQLLSCRIKVEKGEKRHNTRKK